MKALSIISLVVCVFSILLSIAIADIACTDGKHYSYSAVGLIPGILSLIISLWFTAFSIVAVVVVFKKNKSTSVTNGE